MPQLGRQTFSFTRGKNTESGPFSYPEETAQTLTNFDLDIDGSVKRRLGIDIETSGTKPVTVTFADLQEADLSTTEWKNVAGKGGTDFGVVQIDYNLYFFDLSSGTLSSGYKGTVDLSGGKVFDSDDIGRFGYASGFGALFVMGRYLDPTYIEYDEDAGTFTATSYEIEIRDFLGLDDGYTEGELISTRPYSRTAAHDYNLFNQGWQTKQVLVAQWESSSQTGRDRVGDGVIRRFTWDWTKTVLGAYPSNADVWHRAKVSNATSAQVIDKFFPALLDSSNFGNTRAPQGHYIINPFTLDRNKDAQISSAVNSDDLRFDEVATSRPTACAFYNGRIFMGGVEDGSHVSDVFISKQLTDIKESGICYQQNDPTSEFLNGLLPTDGLVIPIPDAGKIVAMRNIGSSVIIFAQNGVWSITGGADSGFTAEAYNLDKVTSVGIDYPNSVVDAEGAVLFWADSGIYAVQIDQTSQAPQILELSKSTIQSAYDAIPADSKLYAKGAYDWSTKKVLWMYHSTGNTVDGNGEERYRYDSILYFDTRLQAFYDYSISELASASPFIAGAFRIGSIPKTTETVNVVDSTGTLIVDGIGGAVTTTREIVDTAANAGLKFLTFFPNGTDRDIGFSEFNNADFLDWETADSTGVDYTSTILTGFDVTVQQTQQGYAKSAGRRKNVVYAITHFNQTETAYEAEGEDFVYDRPSSCNMRIKWDFADDSGYGKWSASKEVYRLKRLYIPSGAGTFEYGREVITTRNKLRGSGKAAQVEYTSSTGKDLQLLGWEINYGVAGRI